MAMWISGVRAAVKMIEDTEHNLNENCVRFDEVTLYPYRTMGGRSNGVSAVFYCQNAVKAKHMNQICVTVYEYWNTDEICLKITQHAPVAMFEKHDEPDIRFKSDEVDKVAYAIQMFLCAVFGFGPRKEWYIQSGFQGSIVYDDKKAMMAVDDAMMDIVLQWCPVDEEVEG